MEKKLQEPQDKSNKEYEDEEEEDEDEVDSNLEKTPQTNLATEPKTPLKRVETESKVAPDSKSRGSSKYKLTEKLKKVKKD